MISKAISVMLLSIIASAATADEVAGNDASSDAEVLPAAVAADAAASEASDASETLVELGTVDSSAFVNVDAIGADDEVE